MKVLVACEYSGRVRDAFIARGHNAISCDLLPTDAPGPHHQGDVLEFARSQEFDMMIAHPPCTRLANSGVRWLHERNLWGEFHKAVEFYKAIRELPIPLKCIENPVMHKYAREELGHFPRQVVQPHWFGEPMYKATGYELHGLPKLERTHWMSEPAKGTDEHKAWSWVHRCPPSLERWKIRSTTPKAIAEAMAAQWG